jgi:hypothetical protein
LLIFQRFTRSIAMVDEIVSGTLFTLMAIGFVLSAVALMMM